jgi:peptide/nickel transport system substrate-binding protein
MHSTDLQVLANLAPVAKQLLEKGGFTVDMQSMDWQTLVSRRAKTEPPAEGGWNALLTSWVAADILNPVMMGFRTPPVTRRCSLAATRTSRDCVMASRVRPTWPSRSRSPDQAWCACDAVPDASCRSGSGVRSLRAAQRGGGRHRGAVTVFWNVSKK